MKKHLNITSTTLQLYPSLQKLKRIKPAALNKFSNFINKKSLRAAQRKKVLHGFYSIKHKK
jgi:hypothetical protein